MKVVLCEVEGGTANRSCAVDDGLEGAAKVLKLGSLDIGNLDDGGLGGQGDSVVWASSVGLLVI